LDHLQRTLDKGSLIPLSEANYKEMEAIHQEQGHFKYNSNMIPIENKGCEYHRIKIQKLSKELDLMIEQNLKIKEKNMKLRLLNQSLSNKVE